MSPRAKSIPMAAEYRMIQNQQNTNATPNAILPPLVGGFGVCGGVLSADKVIPVVDGEGFD